MSTTRPSKRRALSSSTSTSMNNLFTNGQSTFQLVLPPSDPTLTSSSTPTFSFHSSDTTSAPTNMSRLIPNVSITPQLKTISFAPNVTPITFSTPNTLDDDLALLEAAAASNSSSSLRFNSDIDFDALRNIGGSDAPSPAKRRRKMGTGKNATKKESSQNSIPSSPAPSASCPNPSPPNSALPPTPQHIPRPPNAFILFRSSFIRSQSVSARTEGNHGTLSKIVGLLWHTLSYEEQLVWKMKARRVYAEHRKRYPGYSFRNGGGKDSKEKDGETSDSTIKKTKGSISTAAKAKETGTSSSNSASSKTKGSNASNGNVNSTSKSAPKVRKTRQVGPRDLERCAHIASLLAAGLKGERLDAAMQEFDLARRPRELRMQFEVPITKEAWAAANAKGTAKKSEVKEIQRKEEVKEGVDEKQDKATTAPMTTTRTPTLTQPHPIKCTVTEAPRVRRSSSAPIPGTGSECVDNGYNYPYPQLPSAYPTQYHATSVEGDVTSVGTGSAYWNGDSQGQGHGQSPQPVSYSPANYSCNPAPIHSARSFVPQPQQTQEQEYASQIYQQQIGQEPFSQASLYTHGHLQHGVPHLQPIAASNSEIIAPTPVEVSSIGSQRRKRSASSDPPIRRPSFALSHSLSYSASQHTWLGQQHHPFSFSAVPQMPTHDSPMLSQVQGPQPWRAPPPDFSGFSFAPSCGVTEVAGCSEGAGRGDETPCPLSPIKAASQAPIASVTAVNTNVTSAPAPSLPVDDYEFLDMPSLVDAPSSHMMQHPHERFYPSYQQQQQHVHGHPQLSIQTSWSPAEYPFSPVPMSTTTSSASAVDLPPSSAVSGISFFGGYDASPNSSSGSAYEFDASGIPQSPATMSASASVSVGTPRDDHEVLSISPAPVAASSGYTGYDVGYDNNNNSNNYDGYTYDGYDDYDGYDVGAEPFEYNGIRIDQMRAMLNAINSGKMPNLGTAYDDGKGNMVGLNEEGIQEFARFVQNMPGVSH